MDRRRKNQAHAFPAIRPPRRRACVAQWSWPLISGCDKEGVRPMHYTTLGKTQLKVSVAGLGCGGNSRIGLGTGLSEAQSVALVQEALDLGVNLLDTAAAYGTESVVGRAIRGRPRDALVISTKSHVSVAGEPLGGAQVIANLEN